MICVTLARPVPPAGKTGLLEGVVMMRRLVMGFALLVSLSVAAPAEAITNGGADGNQHPNVGGLVAPTAYSDGDLDLLLRHADQPHGLPHCGSL